MNATTGGGALSVSEKNDRQRAGRRRQIHRLGVALALTLATVASAQTYTVLKSFNGSDGSNPYAALVLAGGTLYGTTPFGGSGYIGSNTGTGVVFKVSTDGTSYSVLKSFSGIDGWNPYGTLVLVGDTLYGTTSIGGSFFDPPFLGYGVVFKMNTDGSGYSVLKSFSGHDGAYPTAGLVLAGSTLYGTTCFGGSAYDGYHLGDGVVFKLGTDGASFTVLKDFTGSDGRNPYAGLILAGSTLYGTTGHGGDLDLGVVFSLALLSITTPPLTQTAEAGSTVGFRVKAEAPVPGLAYQWFFGGTHALVGATNALLELTNVQPVEAGAYQVVVTSLGSSVTSAPALLSIIPPVNRRVVPAVHLPGDTGSLLHLEYADNLTAAPPWSSFTNVTLSSGPQFCFDLSQPLPAERFYRTWQTNGPQPTLDLSLATEIPLAGAIGSSVRIDYINQFGPTNAWVTLDTVTLTNTSQLYFDVSAIKQPLRLYRLLPGP